MQEDTYKTISSPSTGLFKEKGSKFIAYAYPVSSEDEIKEKIDDLKKEHFGARHHCWAYKLGIKGEQYRANDDGEPSNSAGKPILGQLDSFEVTNTLIVVVRYFGGTLLGVGGLIQAYRESAKDALLNAYIINKTKEFEVAVSCNYEVVDKIMSCIKQHNCNITNQTFEEVCSLRFYATREVINELQVITQNSNSVTILKE